MTLFHPQILLLQLQILQLHLQSLLLPIQSLLLLPNQGLGILMFHIQMVLIAMLSSGFVNSRLNNGASLHL